MAGAVGYPRTCRHFRGFFISTNCGTKVLEFKQTKTTQAQAAAAAAPAAAAAAEGKGQSEGPGVLDLRIYDSSSEELPCEHQRPSEAPASLQSCSRAKEVKEAEEGFKEMKGSERPSLPNLSVGRYRTFAPFWFLHEFLC